MNRCHLCKGGLLPEDIRVTVMTVFSRPHRSFILTTWCANCRNELSYTSARKLNHAIVQVKRYEETVPQ